MAEDFEILDPQESFGSDKTEGFSYGALVMTAHRKSMENGSKEMKEGYWNNKFDRMGNVHKVWVPDSREEFMNSVAMLRILLEREFDDEITKELKNLDEELAKKYKDFCDKDKSDWQRSSQYFKDIQSNKGNFQRDAMLSSFFPYAYEYVLEEIKTSRKVLSVLLKLVKRLNDFGEVSYKN